MEDIKVNFKLIIIIICISALIVTSIWAGYNLYVELTKDENEGVLPFEGEISSGIESVNNNIESNENNTDFNIIDIIGEDRFEIDNSNAVSPKEGWEKRTYNYKGVGYCAMYYIPNDWERNMVRDKKNGVTIGVNMLKVDNLTKETTYEEFLNKFMETKEEKEFSPQEVKNYSKRIIKINDEKFYVLVEEEYPNAIYEYFCLAKDEYVYYLEVTTSKDNYNQELINSINEIYSTFRIN